MTESELMIFNIIEKAVKEALREDLPLFNETTRTKTIVGAAALSAVTNLAYKKMGGNQTCAALLINMNRGTFNKYRRFNTHRKTGIEK